MTLREACIELRSQLKRTYNDDIGSNPVFGDCYKLIVEALETDKTEEQLVKAKYVLELIAQDPFNGRDGEPDPMKVILRMRVDALNALEKLK